MTDSLLASTDIEEALSRVYVQAVAARAGYTTADYSQDRDGIDILIRAGAYWLNLRGRDETTNKSSITVHIPEQNLFNVDNLRLLMEQSWKGSIP
ncbi:MAG: DUF4365 domain-containing protein [Caldilineaceae bacterium SB0665_bin_25]|nr:DUF4365 domain-containing protein [Caldilineaceae bacterium SB0665_bin_25]